MTKRKSRSIKDPVRKDRKVTSLHTPPKTMALKTSDDALKKKTDYRRKVEETHVISPDVAEAWLTKNVSNRKPRTRHIQRLAIAMKNGLWKETDDPIRFDWDGNLFDGQHRLMACILSKSPFKSRVIYGYPPEMRHTVDNGLQRTNADVLAIGGLKNTTHVAATARLLCYEVAGVRINNPKHNPTREQIEAFVDLHPKMLNYVLQPGTAPRGLTISMISAIYYIESCILGNQETGGEFLKVIKSGIPSYDGCPLHRWRERILTGQGFESKADAWVALKRCYNKWRLREATSGLRFGRETATNTFIEDLGPDDLSRGSKIFDPVEDIEDVKE